MRNLIPSPTLYKKSTSGKILVWRMERDGYCYRTVSGQLNGSLVTSEWTPAKEKNYGKKNYRNSEQQAVYEIQSKYAGKKKKGYFQSIEEMDSAPERHPPMLAKPFKTKLSKKKNYFLQPKLDGVRCIGFPDKLLSRGGEPLKGFEGIQEFCKDFCKEFNLILDGELYLHDAGFNAISSSVSGSSEDSIDLKYFVYDCLDYEKSFKDRWEYLCDLFNKYDHPKKHLIELETTIEYDGNNLEDVFEHWVDNLGYEGVIIRDAHGLYEGGKKSKNLIKYKKFIDKEFLILDIYEGKGNNKGVASTILVLTENGVSCKPSFSGNKEWRKTIWENKNDYIGCEATVQFDDYTPDGSLRFPVVKTIYKDGRNL